MELAIVLGVCAAVVVGVFALGQSIAANERAAWKVYGVCPCGVYREAPFGSLFHIHLDVCPRCGKGKRSTWKLETRRFVAGAWETR